MGLHHGCCAINVDYQAGQKVAFAMHQSESIVIRSEQSKCLPHFEGFGETAKEKVGIDFRVVERKIREAFLFLEIGNKGRFPDLSSARDQGDRVFVDALDDRIENLAFV